MCGIITTHPTLLYMEKTTVLYAVIGLNTSYFLLGVYESEEAAVKAVGGRPDVWTIFKQHTPRQALLPSGEMWVEKLLDN